MHLAVGILCMVINGAESAFCSPYMTVDPCHQNWCLLSFSLECFKCPRYWIFIFNSCKSKIWGMKFYFICKFETNIYLDLQLCEALHADLGISNQLQYSCQYHNILSEMPKFQCDVHPWWRNLMMQFSQIAKWGLNLLCTCCIGLFYELLKQNL